MKTPIKKLNLLYQNLILSIGFCLVLLVLRIKITYSTFFIFLVWNLFLAGIPFLITQTLIRYMKPKSNKFIDFIGFFTWLLFLPNSPYIITDLIHLQNKNSNLLWLDLLLVFVFAINGLVLGLLSLLDMYQIISKTYSRKIASFTIFKVCLLCGYGIYLGRFLCFNSWDIITQPTNLFYRMINSVYEPKVWLMTFAFGGFIWILFLLIKSVSQQKTINNLDPKA
ncbi:MAG: DUF1361 domain-containing protein [Cellulophaga sp.]